MIMTESKIKTIYEHCEGFGNESSFIKAINNLAPATKDFINNNDIVKVLFTIEDNNNVFAWCTFHNSELIDKGFNTRIAQGEIGIRATDQLINLPKDYHYLFLKALNEYFGKDKNKDDVLKSAYRRHENLVFDIIRIEDGLHGKKISLQASTFQLNICNVNREIPKYLVNRSYDSVEVPYNRLTLSYEIIEKTLQTLHLQTYSTLAVWFFPERQPKSKKYQAKARMYKESKSDKNYQKSLRYKNKALTELFDNIIVLQDIEKQVDS